jgi:hypothetical protein
LFHSPAARGSRHPKDIGAGLSTRLRLRDHPFGVPADYRGNDPIGIANGFAAFDLVDILHARRDLPPDGILLVEKARVAKADEELRVGRIYVLRAGHGAADMRLGIELGLEIGIFRAAGPGPVRTASLGHEPSDHAVENDAVVELLAGKLLDVRDMGWGEIGPHFDDDLPLSGL